MFDLFVVAQRYFIEVIIWIGIRWRATTAIWCAQITTASDQEFAIVNASFGKELIRLVSIKITFEPWLRMMQLD